MAKDIYDYASDGIDVPNESADKLAHIAISRFNEAVRWQSSELVGGIPLRHVLRDCYDQYNGILSMRDREIAEAIGVDAYVNLTAMKAGVVQSYLLETLNQANQIPWLIEPTPIPNLSYNDSIMAAKELRTIVESMTAMGGAPSDDQIMQLAANVKEMYMKREFDRAKDSADSMEKLLTDQCMEGGWNTAMYGFITDFTVYPYAVLSGPVPVRKTRLTWVGERPAQKEEVYYEFKSISPWDFWYSPDSPDTQRGTGIFLRQRWTKRQLIDAMKLPSYRAEVIKEVLDEAQRTDFIFRWLSENPEQPDERLIQWNNCVATVDVLVHYGFFSGRELQEQGVMDVEEHEFYNAMITVVGKRTIQVIVFKNPKLNTRPIFTTSFYKTHDRIPSFSIPQRIRDVERCYLIMLRYLMSNASSASGPIVEADYSRLAKYMTDEDIAKIVPNTVYLADASMPNSNPALRFYATPSVMPQYQQALQYFMDLTDRVSNIPAALHGTAQGSGANRTFRGAAMLQGNALKAIQAAVTNIDQFVFEPMGTMLYNYNMEYSKDDSVKGDCQILARGASGMLQREIDRQNSYEILQMVTGAGQQIAQMPRGMEIITWALKNVLQNMGVPKDLLKDPMGQGIPAGAPQEQTGADLSAGGVETAMSGENNATIGTAPQTM